jgi:hypothetical protein
MGQFKLDENGKNKIIENNYTYHPPIGDTAPRYNTINNDAKELAYTILKLTPESREQSLALTALEEVRMWANAAIARNSDRLPKLEGEGVDPVAPTAPEDVAAAVSALSGPAPTAPEDVVVSNDVHLTEEAAAQ